MHGSTGSAFIEQELIYLFLGENGKPTCKFFSTESLSDTTFNGLKDTIKGALKESAFLISLVVYKEWMLMKQVLT